MLAEHQKHNGNGRLPVQAHRVDYSPDVPPWLRCLRRAVQDELSGDELAKIIRAEKERAVKGDKNSRDFIFAILLGGRVSHLLLDSDPKLDLE